MPKKKTKKSAAKRFWKTARGKIKYKRAGAGHLLTGKRRSHKRAMKGTSILSAVETKRITPLLY
jgi:large subunit ribosomal protein L35